MAEGIRIRHKTLKGVMLVIRDKERPFQKPHNNSSFKFPICSTCGYPHECKTYHLQLDSEGTIIVSTTVYDNLSKLIDKGGFDIVNMVAKPPTQHLVVPRADQIMKAFNPESTPEPIRREHVNAD